MSRKRKIATPDGILPDLRPDNIGWGPEPMFLTQPPSDGDRRSSLIRALSWYSANFGRKVAKDCCLYLAESRGMSSSDLKILRSTHERHYDLQLGWMCRLAGRGLQLTESELTRIGDHLRSILSIKNTTDEKIDDKIETKPAKPNIQETMMNRARECAADLDGQFDDYIIAKCPQPLTINVVGLLTERNVLPAHVNTISEQWSRRRDEFVAVQDKSDAQLTEAYSHYGKIGIRNLIKFCDAVLAGLSSYTTVKKATRAPRKRKPVPVEKLVSKVKYLKTFKDDASKVDLTSISPTKLVGATEVFIYDTAKRRMSYLVADSHAGSLSVKGTAILGFDVVKSQTKTIRKPGITLPALMNAGKPAARKVFADLTTVGTEPNGRTNENTLILRVN